ncbi:MAG: poly(3-hydroxybutyrate) depolymerase [Aquabacterium sp.]|nr:poly(3-hydroxybutyrate) depolymerase [Aquabacterium sp.]
MPLEPPQADDLPALQADLGQCTVSGLSSGAFMAVQLQMAHASMFVGAGIVAGGPYRCVESFRGAAPVAADAFVQNALFVCMNPLTPETAPDVPRLLALARQAAADGLIDPLHHLARQRLYIFTGSEDRVVHPVVVQRTRAFYQGLGVRDDQILFIDDVPAGHALLTTNLEDNLLALNQPPYLNRWPQPDAEPQSWAILDHLLGRQKRPPKGGAPLRGKLLRFDQRPYFGHASRASMAAYGYAYVPQSALDIAAQGKACRVHVALHGCKQGASHVDFVNGRADRGNNPPYGLRYVNTTGYNEIADRNNLVVLYPQVEGRDDGQTQNPEGCWDWWGYSSTDPDAPDFHSQRAIQIAAIHGMLQRLGSH